MYFLVAGGALVWAHCALERNVNRMARQLQDQVHEATRRIDGLEQELFEQANVAKRRIAELEQELHELKTGSFR